MKTVTHEIARMHTINKQATQSEARARARARLKFRMESLPSDPAERPEATARFSDATGDLVRIRTERRLRLLTVTQTFDDDGEKERSRNKIR